METSGPIALILHADESRLERIFCEAAREYVQSRRARVEPFVDRHFSLRGSARLHRVALGADILRAPANLALAVPHVLARMGEGAARRGGATRTADWLSQRDILIMTAVQREVEWLIHTDLLELPFAQKSRESPKDALAEAVMRHPEIAASLDHAWSALEPRLADPTFRARLEGSLQRYVEGRAAASEIATALISVAAGATAFHQLTPSAFTLGPLLAGALAQHAAVSAFPLGIGFGSIWYGAFPAAPSAVLVGGVTGGLLGVAAVCAAFAGVVTDPVERAIGSHEKRLVKLIDAVEADLIGAGDRRFGVKSHYVPRLLDMFECLRVAYAITQ